MEKAGSLFKNEGMVEKGQAKRAAAGNDQFDSSTGGNTGSYGSGNNDNNY
jgi:hypothetical protein